ncbi:MAG: RsmB/NOP family class I SAM-dependent RNA methyltransferase [Opitutae bacterium]|nr:RsmB/NOP family class I SAM-dependent RNA methyltransferase [Opitutae bacterium]
MLNHAARILKTVQAGTPADQALRESLVRTRHYSAPAERRAISRAVFAYFRWWRWLEPKDSLQKQLEAARTLQARFDKNPASFKPEALAARAVPEWFSETIFWPEVGAVAPNGPRALEGKRPYPTEVALLRQLQREPALWIRAKQGLAAKVAASLGHCAPAELGVPLSALSSQLSARAYTGLTDLYRTPEFQAGEFEIQDLASQLVGLACAPQPGETWWDACAGEGGKSMHLSDLMQNKGLLWVSDRSERRLAKLKERAARAKVFNFRAAPWQGDAKLPTKTKFDGVLVDAPCSGIGTWQRNPHARWTTRPTDVHELAAVQARLLDHAAGSLKPGGRLVYAVCTLTRAETTAIADAFTAAHPDFEPALVFSAQHSALSTQFFLWPHELNANGMFIAAWRRK